MSDSAPTAIAEFNPPLPTDAEQFARLTAEVERLRAALADIAKSTVGYEIGMPHDEAHHYFRSRFFEAQNKARAALTQEPRT